MADVKEDEFSDFSFDESVLEFKKCAQACLAYQTGDNIELTLPANEDTCNIFDNLNRIKSKRGRSKKEKVVNKNESKSTKTAKDVEKTKPESAETALPVSDSLEELILLSNQVQEIQEEVSSHPLPRTRGRRGRRANLAADVPVDLDSMPLSQRMTRSRRRGSRIPRTAVVLNSEPIVIEDEPRPSAFVLDSIELQDSDEEEIPVGDISNEIISLSDENSRNSTSLIDDVAPVDDDNSEVRVKVWWRFLQMHFFNIRRYQKLTTIFDHFAKLENVPQECIWLTVRDTVTVNPTDTPDSLKLGVADIIEGGVTSQKLEPATSLVPEPAVEEDSLEFKLLIKDRKKPLLLRIKSDQNMKLLMIKCAEELEVSLDCLKFSFDGEILDPSATPSDLDMEGGECIEVKICK